MHIAKRIVILMIIISLITGITSAEAGRLSYSLGIMKEGVKIFKRQFPTVFEKVLIQSGKAEKIGEKIVIKRNHTFDPSAKDAFGKTNITRMSEGKSPIGKDGTEVQLHHYQQKDKGPIIEMTATEHRSNSRALHHYTNESEIDRQGFNRWKQDYWNVRAKEF